MNVNDYVKAVESSRTCDCEAVVFIGAEKPWGIRWTCGAVDPFTDESPITSYFTSAEAIRASCSNYDSHDPADFPKVTEAVTLGESQDHTLESIRIDVQAACQVACIVRDKMPHDAYRDELSRIATALAELCNDVSRLEMAELDMRHSLELHKELCASLGWIKGE